MTHPRRQDGSITHEETGYARAPTYDDPTEDPVSTARIICLSGGINPIGSKMAEALGYDAFYMPGGNTSAHQLGWPDSGTSMRDMVDNARKIVLTVQILVFADADTGYGDAICPNGLRTWQEIQEAIRLIPRSVVPLIPAHLSPYPSLQAQQDAGAAAVWFPALTTMAGLQLTGIS